MKLNLAKIIPKSQFLKGLKGIEFYMISRSEWNSEAILRIHILYSNGKYISFNSILLQQRQNIRKFFMEYFILQWILMRPDGCIMVKLKVKLARPDNKLKGLWRADAQECQPWLVHLFVGTWFSESRTFEHLRYFQKKSFTGKESYIDGTGTHKIRYMSGQKRETSVSRVKSL